MELLERDEALAALAEARESAARGDGRAVLVSGEPGIGKTALVTRFLEELGRDGARVLLGTSDDLSIPRPLGPFRDLAGSVSPRARAGARRRRAAARDAGAARGRARAAAAADGARARGRALGRRRDARRDHRGRPPHRRRCRRCSCSPSAPARRRPATGCTRRSARSRAADAVILELAPLSESAVAALAGGRAGEVYAPPRGNPFYVSELLGAPPDGRAAADRRRAPCSDARPASTSRRGG